MTTQPRWLPYARTFIGLREIPGKFTAPQISRWLRQMRAWWDNDETPWCGVFVDGIFRDLGIPPAKLSFRARAWLDWGVPLIKPAVGCVVVFERGRGGGHVGFVVGQDEQARLMVLGGNQGNAVSIAPFDRVRVLGYRWPVGSQEPSHTARLPLLAANGKPASRDEA